MKKKLIGVLIFCMLLTCFGSTAMAAEKYPYYVTVNLTENIVTVYEKDEAGKYTVPVKAFTCSGGNYTPEGTFRTSQKYEWRILFGNVWGQYATRITGHILFHSVPYFEKDKSTLEYEEYNKLGTTASAGCIRLRVEDVKWIYDNCPVGTTVKMYRGNVKEPLQPATVQKIDVKDTLRRGWDPTDPDPANPWKKGEIRNMMLSDSRTTVDAYYENWTYYLSAKDAATVFSKLGVELRLPAEEKQPTGGTVTAEYNNEKFELNCRVKDGTVYYKIRDLATMAGVEMTWDKDTKEMGIASGDKIITMSQNLETKATMSFPMKLAAFFFR